MRILRLRITNFRGVDECVVEFPPVGVTIVEGPNEVGKTSLTEAIDLVLSERDDSSKRSVRAVKPVDKDVGAEVEIEVSSPPYRFVLAKRWHRQRMTELDIIEPRREQLTGREAHDRVQQILAETLDESLWSALRLRQGAALDQPAFAGGSLGRALDLAAGGDNLVGDREDDLWQRVSSERDRFWTATGQARVERTTLTAGVDDAAGEVEALESALRALESDADEVDRLVAATRELQRSRDEHELLERELSDQVGAIELQRSDVARLRGVWETAGAELERAKEVARARRDLVERVDEATAAVAAHESDADGARPSLAAAELRLDAAKQAVLDGRAAVAEAEAAYRLAVNDETFRRQEIEYAQFSERLGRIEEAIRRRTEAEDVLSANRVDEVLVAAIREAHLEVARAEATASAGASVLRAEALTDLEVQIGGESVAMSPGEGREVVISGSVEFEIPHVVNLVVTAGAEAKSTADRLETARATLEGACGLAGVEDLAAAQIAFEERRAAVQMVASAEDTIARDLRDLSIEALTHKVSGHREHLDSYEGRRPSDSALPVDFDEAKRVSAAWDLELQSRRDALVRTESDEAAASGTLKVLQLDAAGTKAMLTQARERAASESASLEAVRQLASDEQIAEQLSRAEASARACRASLVAAEEELLAQDPESVETRVGNVRAVLKRIADDMHEHDNQIRDLRTTLSVKGEEGLALQLDAAKTRLVHLTRQRDRMEARAAAAKLLYDTMDARRAEAHRQYVAPFRRRIESLGRIVYGPTLEIELDDDLRIARRTLAGVTLEFDDLSTGAKEQLGMISRLACASIVAADGGAPAVIDDALGWSDPRKLEGMGAVIRVAGQSCQVIIMTCTPGRYSGVGGATVVRLAN